MYDRRPLHYAVRSGKSTAVGFLVQDARVTPNALDTDGMSPLAGAVQTAQTASVALLLAASTSFFVSCFLCQISDIWDLRRAKRIRMAQGAL